MSKREKSGRPLKCRNGLDLCGPAGFALLTCMARKKVDQILEYRDFSEWDPSFLFWRNRNLVYVRTPLANVHPSGS